MKDKIREQVLAVRATGITNMFDCHAVQRIAFDKGFYELVNFIEEHKGAYGHLLLTGEFPEDLEI